MAFCSHLPFLRCLAPFLAMIAGCVHASGPLLSVRFEERAVLFSGTLDSEESLKALTSAVKGARPDLPVDDAGIAIDPSAPVPNLGDVTSLLAELGLSTHEGRFEIWPDRILIAGLTDSLVTQTALKIRVRPILDGRALVTRICVVATDDLPRAPSSLSEVLFAEGTPGLTPRPGGEKSYLPPGLLLEKLFPTLVMLGQFTQLERSGVGLGIDPGRVRAIPLETTVTGESRGEKAGGELPTFPLRPINPGMIAVPVQEYEILPTIRFSANSFFLQSNQTEVLDDLAKQLLSDGRPNSPVIVEPVKPSGGSGAFNDYLCERRAGEVLRFLAERGVDTGLFSIRAIQSSLAIDEGEVRLKIELPLPASDSESPLSNPPETSNYSPGGLP